MWDSLGAKDVHDVMWRPKSLCGRVTLLKLRLIGSIPLKEGFRL